MLRFLHEVIDICSFTFVWNTFDVLTSEDEGVSESFLSDIYFPLACD